jgi:hypothetical protein
MGRPIAADKLAARDVIRELWRYMQMVESHHHGADQLELAARRCASPMASQLLLQIAAQRREAAEQLSATALAGMAAL